MIEDPPPDTYTPTHNMNEDPPDGPFFLDARKADPSYLAGTGVSLGKCLHSTLEKDLKTMFDGGVQVKKKDSHETIWKWKPPNRSYQRQPDTNGRPVPEPGTLDWIAYRKNIMEPLGIKYPGKDALNKSYSILDDGRITYGGVPMLGTQGTILAIASDKNLHKLARRATTDQDWKNFKKSCVAKGIPDFEWKGFQLLHPNFAAQDGKVVRVPQPFQHFETPAATLLELTGMDRPLTTATTPPNSTDTNTPSTTAETNTFSRPPLTTATAKEASLRPLTTATADTNTATADTNTFSRRPLTTATAEETSRRSLTTATTHTNAATTDTNTASTTADTNTFVGTIRLTGSTVEGLGEGPLEYSKPLLDLTNGKGGPIKTNSTISPGACAAGPSKDVKPPAVGSDPAMNDAAAAMLSLFLGGAGTVDPPVDAASVSTTVADANTLKFSLDGQQGTGPAQVETVNSPDSSNQGLDRIGGNTNANVSVESTIVPNHDMHGAGTQFQTPARTPVNRGISVSGLDVTAPPPIDSAYHRPKGVTWQEHDQQQQRHPPTNGGHIGPDGFYFKVDNTQSLDDDASTLGGSTFGSQSTAQFSHHNIGRTGLDHDAVQRNMASRDGRFADMVKLHEQAETHTNKRLQDLRDVFKISEEGQKHDTALL